MNNHTKRNNRTAPAQPLECRILVEGRAVEVRAGEFFDYLRLRVITLHRRKENLFVAKIDRRHYPVVFGEQGKLLLEALEQNYAPSSVARALRSLLGLMIQRYGY